METAFCKINGFEDWFNGGCLIPQKVDNSNTESDKNGNIYLVKLPSNGIKDLVKIKQIFGMDVAISELLKMSKTLPCKLMSNIKYAKAIKLIQEFGESDILEFRD